MLEHAQDVVGWFAVIPVLNLWAIRSSWRVPAGGARRLLVAAAGSTLLLAAGCLVLHLRPGLSLCFGVTNIVVSILVLLGARRAAAAYSHERRDGQDD